MAGLAREGAQDMPEPVVSAAARLVLAVALFRPQARTTEMSTATTPLRIVYYDRSPGYPEGEVEWRRT
jgi:hypothetical protein